MPVKTAARGLLESLVGQPVPIDGCRAVLSSCWSRAKSKLAFPRSAIAARSSVPCWRVRGQVAADVPRRVSPGGQGAALHGLHLDRHQGQRQNPRGCCSLTRRYCRTVGSAPPDHIGLYAYLLLTRRYSRRSMRGGAMTATSSGASSPSTWARIGGASARDRQRIASAAAHAARKLGSDRELPSSARYSSTGQVISRPNRDR